MTVGAAAVYGWMHGQTAHRAGVGFFRIAEPLRVVSTVVETFTGTDIDQDVLERCDTIVVHNPTDIDRTLTWHDLAAAGQHRLVLDIDDAMWAPDFPGFRDYYRPDVLDRMFSNVERAHVVTTPSPVIAEHLTRFNPNVWLVPNTVPAWVCEHPMPPRARPTIGFQGSDSHITDWTAAEMRHLSRFLGEHPHWDVHTYGNFGGELPGRARNTPWFHNVHDYWRAISLDVGIGPLRNTIFNRAKSNLRAVEYMALGIVPVLPYLRPYFGAYTDGVEGRFIYAHQTLSGVLRDVADLGAAGRAEMAAAGRARARANHTSEGNLERIMEAWMSA